MNNTTEIQTTDRPSAIQAMASRLEVEPKKLISTLTNTVFKGATNDELLALVVTANEYQLNPLLKEMYAFPAKGGGIVPVVGIDGWLKVINRQPNFDGMKVRVSSDGEEATCEIYLKDRKHPIEVTEYLDECKRNTEPWKMMPKRMLRHKAIMQAGRVAFGIAGIQDEDEAKDTMRNVTPPTPTVRDTPIDPCAPLQGDEVKVAKFVQREEPKKQPEETQAREGKVLSVDKLEGTNYTLYTCQLQIGEKHVQASTFSKRVGENAKYLIDQDARLFLCVNAKDSSKIDLIDVQPLEEGGAE